MMAFMERDPITEPVAASTSRPLLWATLLSLVAVLSAGLATGFAVAMLEHRGDGVGAVEIGLLALFIVAAAAAGWGAWRFYRGALVSRPMANSERKSISVLALAVPLGIVAGLAAAVTGGEASLFAAGPLPATAAVVLSLAALAAIGLSIVWVRSIDEHERRAHLLGAEAGIFAFTAFAPVWWFCARAELLPPVDPLGIYLIAAVPYLIVWLRHRYFG